MAEPLHVIGIDLSTQTVTAALVGVIEAGSSPTEIIMSSAWRASRPCAEEGQRKAPAVWVRLVRECVSDLKRIAPEASQACAIGVGTTFPGIVAIPRSGPVDPRYVSLYDNADDAGLCAGDRDDLLAAAEAQTVNRMWPGNMAIGLVHLIKSHGLDLNDAAALVPPNTAFAHELLRAAGLALDAIPTDLTEAVIGGLYDARTGEPLPPGVARLLREALPEADIELVRSLLPVPGPAWRNIVPQAALPAVRDLLGLPELVAVSIGAGDSPLATLALSPDPDTVLNVRGSSDSPMIVVDSPRPTPPPLHPPLAGGEKVMHPPLIAGEKGGWRETVLHYPLPTARTCSDSPWLATAPMLRSGKVWDWVRRLRFAEDDPHADAELEKLALEAFKRRPMSDAAPLVFDTALGGERAPDWDSHATGTLSGLAESHGIGDVALAALEGMSMRLKACLDQMEARYDVHPPNLLLAGGPVRNALWNWITATVTGKKMFVTDFTDASLLGAAMIGYAASYDGSESDEAISRRLRSLSKLSAGRPLVRPRPVTAPD